MQLKQELLDAAEHIADRDPSAAGSRSEQHARRLDVLQERFTAAQAELQSLREREALFKKTLSERADEVQKHREVVKKLGARIEVCIRFVL